MKQLIKKICRKFFPAWLNRQFRVFSCIIEIVGSYYSDINRYLKFSTTIKKPKTYEQLEARIISHYHALEKALSFREKKVIFGEDVAKSLLKLLEEYVFFGFSIEKKSFKSAVDILKKYISFCQDSRNDCDYLKDISLKLLNLYKNTEELGGTIKLIKKDILEAVKGDFKELAFSRHSIRDFSNEEVREEIIVEAVKIAQRAPSACNRQTSKVIIISDRFLKEKVLQLQTGNKGFGHLANKLIIVASDLQYFEGAIERNQAFVDGGIFSMSLLYALHYQGLGVCSLNWATKPNKDKKLRKLLGLKESTTIILIIAVGHLPNELLVAKSTRKDVNDIIEQK